MRDFYASIFTDSISTGKREMHIWHKISKSLLNVIYHQHIGRHQTVNVYVQMECIRFRDILIVDLLEGDSSKVNYKIRWQ